MIDTINVINLSPHGQPAKSNNVNIKKAEIIRYREERILSLCHQSKEHGFAIRFWEGEYTPQAFFGITASFKKIVRWAKETNQQMVCIGEDDLLFTAPGAWQYYLDNMPSDFDIYSGGIYSGQIQDGRIVNGYSGNTLITVHEKFYDFFLGVRDDYHLDRTLGSFAFEKNYRIVKPFVVIQLSGFSDNHRRQTSHEGKLSDMILFGR